jgi:hypothetical protein
MIGASEFGDRRFGDRRFGDRRCRASGFLPIEDSLPDPFRFQEVLQGISIQ